MTRSAAASLTAVLLLATACSPAHPSVAPGSAGTTADDRREPLTDPVLEYTHRAVGIAVVGGYIYQGSAIPALQANTSSPTSRATSPALQRGTARSSSQRRNRDGTAWPWRRLLLRDGPLDRYVTGMGEDAAGELYVLTHTEFGPVGETGEVLKLVAPG